MPPRRSRWHRPRWSRPPGERYRARSHREGSVVCEGSSPSSASSARKVVGVAKWIT
jgi:hypothetical protein